MARDNHTSINNLVIDAIREKIERTPTNLEELIGTLLEGEEVTVFRHTEDKPKVSVIVKNPVAYLTKTISMREYEINPQILTVETSRMLNRVRSIKPYNTVGTKSTTG